MVMTVGYKGFAMCTIGFAVLGFSLISLAPISFGPHTDLRAVHSLISVHLFLRTYFFRFKGEAHRLHTEWQRPLF